MTNLLQVALTTYFLNIVLATPDRAPYAIRKQNPMTRMEYVLVCEEMRRERCLPKLLKIKECA